MEEAQWQLLVKTVLLEESESRALYGQLAIDHINNARAKLTEQPTLSSAVQSIAILAKFHLSQAAQMAKMAPDAARQKQTVAAAQDPPGVTPHLHKHLSALRNRCTIAETQHAKAQAQLRSAISVNEMLLEFIEHGPLGTLPPIDSISKAHTAANTAKNGCQHG